MKTTPQELAEKKQRNNLQSLCNSVASAFSFKQIKTWHDVFKKAGQSEEYILSNYEPAQLSKAVDFKELKHYFDKLKAQLEETIAARRQTIVDEAKREEEKVKPSEQPLVSASVVEAAADETGIHNDKDYGLISSPNESAFLFWFQKKAIKELLDGIL